jgi:hypothetical protein
MKSKIQKLKAYHKDMMEKLETTHTLLRRLEMSKLNPAQKSILSKAIKELQSIK